MIHFHFYYLPPALPGTPDPSSHLPQVLFKRINDPLSLISAASHAQKGEVFHCSIGNLPLVTAQKR